MKTQFERRVRAKQDIRNCAPATTALNRRDDPLPHCCLRLVAAAAARTGGTAPSASTQQRAPTIRLGVALPALSAELTGQRGDRHMGHIVGPSGRGISSVTS